MNEEVEEFYSQTEEELFRKIDSGRNGLTNEEASRRLIEFGRNEIDGQKRTQPFALFVSQFKSPIILILLFASLLSYFLHDPTDALIILVILLISGILGFWQEKGAADAVQRLLQTVEMKATVVRFRNEKGSSACRGCTGRSCSSDCW